MSDERVSQPVSPVHEFLPEEITSNLQTNFIDRKTPCKDFTCLFVPTKDFVFLFFDNKE